MAVSGKALLGASLIAFGSSMILASGFGVTFGAALFASLAIAVTISSISHFAPHSHIRFWPTGGFFHRSLFGGPSHSRTFVPGGVHHTPSRSFFGGAPTHTRSFRPAASSFTPSFRSTSSAGFFGGFGGGPTHVSSVFVPRR